MFCHILPNIVAKRARIGTVGNLRVENGRLSDRYRIETDTGCIVSNRIGYCCHVLCRPSAFILAKPLK